jgi:hypothetical protein
MLLGAQYRSPKRRRPRLKPPALLGVQWELGLPADGARTCAADFTLDDLRLLPAPAP